MNWERGVLEQKADGFPVKADFNEDTYEDILLRVRNDAVGGSYVSHNLFLLTNKGGAGFQILQEFRL